MRPNTQPSNRRRLKGAVPPGLWGGDPAQHHQASLRGWSLRTPADEATKGIGVGLSEVGPAKEILWLKVMDPTRLFTPEAMTLIPNERHQIEWILKGHIHLAQQWNLTNCRQVLYRWNATISYGSQKRQEENVLLYDFLDMRFKDKPRHCVILKVGRVGKWWEIMQEQGCGGLQVLLCSLICDSVVLLPLSSMCSIIWLVSLI